MSPYSKKPIPFLSQLSLDLEAEIGTGSYCAGFELQVWRCNQLADHLIEWIADYALKEDELEIDHVNMYIRLREAAVRIYSSDNYKSRGEVGEILLHGICREFFNTIPIAPRVFYLTSSNEVVKSFDLVHVKYLEEMKFELWLGEAKFYENWRDATVAAISTVKTHIDQGFLNREKLILGPQISKSVPHYSEIRRLLSVQTSLDQLFQNAVFPICIACDSESAVGGTRHDEAYVGMVLAELAKLSSLVKDSNLHKQIRIVLIYVPLGSKKKLAQSFDARLKGLTGCP